MHEILLAGNDEKEGGGGVILNAGGVERQAVWSYCVRVRGGWGAASNV